MVASKSQRDPKEYLALLTKLKEYEPENYRCYKIDMHLKRYEKALEHLSKCEGSNYSKECLELIKQERLYSKGVELFDSKNEKLTAEIWNLYGQYLLTKKYYEEAAIGFKKSNDAYNAIKAYQLSGNWNAALTVATSFKLPSAEMINIATNLAENVKSNGDICNAAYIYEIYGNNIKRSIEILIEGHQWQYAERLLAKVNDESLKIVFKDGLISHYEIMLEFIYTTREALLRHCDRLQTVMKLKTQTLRESHSENLEIDDSVSERSSVLGR